MEHQGRMGTDMASISLVSMHHTHGSLPAIQHVWMGIWLSPVALRRIEIGESVKFQGQDMTRIEKHIWVTSFDVLGTEHRKA